MNISLVTCTFDPETNFSWGWQGYHLFCSFLVEYHFSLWMSALNFPFFLSNSRLTSGGLVNHQTPLLSLKRCYHSLELTLRPAQAVAPPHLIQSKPLLLSIFNLVWQFHASTKSKLKSGLSLLCEANMLFFGNCGWKVGIVPISKEAYIFVCSSPQALQSTTRRSTLIFSDPSPSSRFPPSFQPLSLRHVYSPLPC